MTISQLRPWLVARLGQAGIAEAELEAEIILGWLWDCGPVSLIMDDQRRLDAPLAARLVGALQRRQRREPLAYILGEWEFWSLPFAVGPGVLIPRPETELLIQEALAFARSRDCILGVNPRDQRRERVGDLAVEAASGAAGLNVGEAPARAPLQILDLGTGSGILAVVLARELATSRVVAIDRWPSALAIAEQNVRRHGVGQRVSLVAGHWLTPLAPEAVFDLVVANPPYVVRGELAGLQPEVRDYEPRTALDGGERGLDEIGEICRSLPPVLRPGALVLIEIGWDQEAAVRAMFSADSRYDQVAVLPDLAGHPRVLRCRRSVSDH